MSLLQRFCTAVIDASDAWGASMQGVDIRTHRENLYGHPDGITAAREAGASPRVQVEAGRSARDPSDGDEYCGLFAPTGLALRSPIPGVRSFAQDRELEEQQARWRDNFGRDSLTGF
jgi:hypothetical protein